LPHVHPRVRAAPAILLASALLASSLGAAPRGTLAGVGPLEFDPIERLASSCQAMVVQAVGRDRAEAFRKTGIQPWLEAMIRQNRGMEVLSRTVTYATEDARGRSRTCSGRVFFPTNPVRSWQAGRAPLVFYQPDVQTRRDQVPSRNRGAEALVGALGAQLFGFAVAMPDGDGMGEDGSGPNHAFYHAATGSRCLLDMVRAVEWVEARQVFDATGYVWDGTTYLAGYGEGGFMAAAALRALAIDPQRTYGALQVDGAACMAGPLDFSATLLRTLKDGTAPAGRPFVPACFLAAWQDLFPADLSLRAGINPLLLRSHPTRDGNPDGLTVVDWLAGRFTPEEIDLRIRARLTGNPRQPVTARSVLNDAWVKANLDPAGTRVVRDLKANDLDGDWKPPCPVLLGQVPGDPWAGPQTSRDLLEAWKRKGFEPIRAELAPPDPALGPLVAMPLAFLWIRSGCDPAFRSRAPLLLDQPNRPEPDWAE